jgi:hypothetical protein
VRAAAAEGNGRLPGETPTACYSRLTADFYNGMVDGELRALPSWRKLPCIALEMQLAIAAASEALTLMPRAEAGRVALAEFLR